MSSPADVSEHRFGREQYLLLALITALAVGLRCLGLSSWSFWVDEAHTYRDVVSDLSQFWQSHVAHYPLSYLLLRGLQGIMPSFGEGWMRLPFALFGMASVPLLAIMGRGLVGRGAALWAALFLAVCPWHIYWSQNARSYAMMMFFAMIGVLACFHALRGRSPWTLISALGALLVSGLCHPSGYLALVACLGFSCMVPLLPGHRARSGISLWLPLLGLVLIIALLPLLLPSLEYARRAKPGGSIIHLLQTSAFFLRVPMLIACFGGLALLWREHNRRALYLGTWAFLPLLILGLVSASLFKVTAQYEFCSLPAICLLAGYAAAECWRRLTGTALRFLLPAILVLDLGSYDYFYFTNQTGDRPRLRDAVSHVLRQPDQRRLWLTTNSPGLRYYLQAGVIAAAEHSEDQIISIETWDVANAGGGERFMAAHLERANRAGQAMYVLLTPPEFREKDVDGSCDLWLRANARRILDLPVWIGPKDMTVIVYRVDG